MTALPANSGDEPVEAPYISSHLTVCHATTSGKAKDKQGVSRGKILCWISKIKFVVINMRNNQNQLFLLGTIIRIGLRSLNPRSWALLR